MNALFISVGWKVLDDGYDRPNDHKEHDDDSSHELQCVCIEADVRWMCLHRVIFPFLGAKRLSGTLSAHTVPEGISQAVENAFLSFWEKELGNGEVGEMSKMNGP